MTNSNLYEKKKLIKLVKNMKIYFFHAVRLFLLKLFFYGSNGLALNDWIKHFCKETPEENIPNDEDEKRRLFPNSLLPSFDMLGPNWHSLTPLYALSWLRVIGLPAC